MSKIKINILDPVWCELITDNPMLIKGVFQYTAVYWRKTRFRKERFEYKKSFIRKKSKGKFYFYKGNIRRVLTFCKRRMIEVELTRNFEYPEPTKKPHVKGITFRPDQKEALKRALTLKNGVLVAPTGSGKTILMMGIISAYPKAKILVLAHTKSLVFQTYEEFKENFDSVQRMQGGICKMITERIVISTIQSFYMIQYQNYSVHFDIVIVDETHKLTKFDQMYDKVLSNILAPIRLGFTATPRKETESELCSEGLLGPIIYNLTINKAVEHMIVAKPKIKIIATPYDYEVRALRNYPDVYKHGITLNRKRNMLILETAIEHMKKGRSVLIMIVKLEHGKALIRLAKRKYHRRLHFVQGSTPDDIRNLIKKDLTSKKLMWAICSTVWKEGINIPSLGVIINAAGGKSEINTLQAIGRGLRRTDEKSIIHVVDFFDSSHNHLLNHFGERVTLYMEMGWM